MRLPSMFDTAHGRRQVAQAVTNLLASVPINAKPDLDTFIAHLAAWRQRPIMLVPFSTVMRHQAPPFSGLWVKTPGFDCVVYDDKAAPVTQRHAVFHEIGHMMLDHLSEGELDEIQFRLMCLMLPDLDPEFIRDTIRAGLCRSHCTSQGAYDSRQEDLAEEFATQIALKVAPTGLIHPVRAVDPSDREVIARFAAILGPGWSPTP